jgi:CysZ protein
MLLVVLALWAGTLAAGVVLGLAVALLLAAPVLERLSHRTEIVTRGGAPGLSAGMRWEVAQSLRSAAYFMAVAPFVLLLGLIPVVGPPLAALWAAHALAVQQTEAPLVRRGLGFHDRRQWHRRWRAESLGFGLAAFLTLLVPLANLLLAPALAVGATLLVVDLEGAIEAAPAPENAAPSLAAEDLPEDLPTS